MNLDQFISKTSGVDQFLKEQSKRILLEKKEVIALQNEERLLKEGRDTKGNIIGIYTEGTREKRRRAGKPVPSDGHWTSYWSGEFLSGIEVSAIDNERLKVTSTYEHTREMEAHNPNYLGLDEQEAEYISNLLADELVNTLVAYYT